jgi:O-antigen ligase
MVGATDDAPHLPPRPARQPEAQQLELALSTPTPRPGSHLETDWPPFEDPQLLSLKVAGRVVVGARAIALVWVVSLLLVVVRARGRIVAGDDDQSGLVDLAAWTGVAVVTVIAIASWLWSDRSTRNVHRLDGRLPSRTRCISAWSLPLVWAVLLGVTVVRLDPSEPADVRPAIVVTLMALTMWRPYALVRRILVSLTRVRSDGLIETAYVLDLSTIGLLWWQLASWSSQSTPSDVGAIDVRLGIVAAAAVGIGLNLASWAILVRDVQRAHAERLLALRTRHDHRHLRLRGINPMDPEVRLALLRIRQEEELERLRRAEPIPVPDSRGPRVIDPPGSPEPASRPRTVLRTTGVPEPADTSGAMSDSAVTPNPLDTVGIGTEVAEHDERKHEAEPATATTPAAHLPGADVGDNEGALETETQLVAQVMDGAATDELEADIVGATATSANSAQVVADLADETVTEAASPDVLADLRSQPLTAKEVRLNRLRLAPENNQPEAAADSAHSLLDRLSEYGIKPNLSEPIPPPEHDSTPPTERRLSAGHYALEVIRRKNLDLGVFLGLLFLIPARLVVPGFGAAGAPAALLALVMLALLLIDRLGYRASDQSVAAPNPVSFALVIYVGFLLLTWGIGRTRTLTPLVGSNSDRALIALASLVGVFWFVLDRVRTSEAMLWLLDVMLVGSMFMCVIGVIQFYVGIDPIASVRIPGLVDNGSATVDTRSIFNRPFGTALHPIEFGVVAASLLPIAWWRAKNGSWWHWCAIVLLALGAMVSISRSAVLAGGIAVIVLILGSSWRDRLNLIATGLALVVVAGSVIPGLVGTILSLFGYVDDDPSIQARVERTPAVLRLIAEHPWIGRGFGTFTIEQDLLLDNEIQKMTIETGIIGVALFLVLIVVVVWAALLPRQLDPRLDGLGVALSASVLSVAISFYTFDAFFYHILMSTLFMNVALVAVLWKLGSRPSDPHPAPRDEAVRQETEVPV